MTDDSRDPGAPGPGEQVLLDVDAELNIFALANGMDLYRNHEDDPDRVLEWFRDGLERRIHLRPCGDHALDLDVAAEGRVDGVRRRGRVGFRSSVAPDELRVLLVQAIDAANDLGPDDVEAV